ncbi:hypothetical protein LUX32_34405 [Actinomadura madurae]|nr:hypothetical protein [Actinomadura madurae]MCP9982154.1 hypothetical protein [Actinomadura madurae]
MPKQRQVAFLPSRRARWIPVANASRTAPGQREAGRRRPRYGQQYDGGRFRGHHGDGRRRGRQAGGEAGHRPPELPEGVPVADLAEDRDQEDQTEGAAGGQRDVLQSGRQMPQ